MWGCTVLKLSFFLSQIGALAFIAASRGSPCDSTASFVFVATENPFSQKIVAGYVLYGCVT